MFSRIYTADVPLEHVVIIDFVLVAITSFDRIWSYSSRMYHENFTVNISKVIFGHKAIKLKFGQTQC